MMLLQSVSNLADQRMQHSQMQSLITYSRNDLIKKMQEYLADTDIEPYGFTYKKEQIQKQYGKKNY